jgi:hypothetical protein
MLPLSVSYPLEVGKDKIEGIIKYFLAIHPPQKEIVMTAAQQLRKEGRQEVKKEERLILAKTMLTSGYKAEEIARLIGLSINEFHKPS